MKYQFCAESDKGIKKDKNEDSVLVKEALHHGTPVLMAAVCDGMGGLQDGEVASCMLVNRLDKWFEQELPKLISFTEEKGLNLEKALKYALVMLIRKANEEIQNYTNVHKLKGCGTTVVVLILYNGRYYGLNVGDSRIYVFRNHLYQLSTDQTVVQRMVDLGQISEKQAETHPDRSRLLQCVGMNRKVIPEYLRGECFQNDLFLLCSDGLRHKIGKKELENVFRIERPKTPEQLSDAAQYLISENMRRKETDNLSCVLIRARRS